MRNETLRTTSFLRTSPPPPAPCPGTRLNTPRRPAGRAIRGLNPRRRRDPQRGCERPLHPESQAGDRRSHRACPLPTGPWILRVRQKGAPREGRGGGQGRKGRGAENRKGVEGGARGGALGRRCPGEPGRAGARRGRRKRLGPQTRGPPHLAGQDQVATARWAQREGASGPLPLKAGRSQCSQSATWEEQEAEDQQPQKRRRARG